MARFAHRKNGWHNGENQQTGRLKWGFNALTEKGIRIARY